LTTAVSRQASNRSRVTAGLPSTSPAVARLLLFLSGSTALAFQTLWVKQLTLVVGVEVFAVSLGVAAFFAGLATGAAVIGVRIDGAVRPLRWYAGLEAAVALLGLGTTLLLPLAPGPFVRLGATVGPLAWVLPGLMVAIPAFCMGGTLPAAMRALAPADSSLGREAGSLYAWNTAGAVAGALITPFLLVPWLGVRGAGLTAALACLATAGLAAWVDGHSTVTQPRARAKALPADDVAPRRAIALGLVLYACAGGIAMGYEVLWSQIVAPFTSTRGAAFAVVLAVYLFGLAAGSAAWSRYADRVTDRWAAFGLLISAAGLLAVLTYASLGTWLPEAQAAVGQAVARLTDSHALGMYSRFLVAAFLIVLPATLLLGAAFPAAVRLTGEVERAGTSVGRVAAWNMAGSIAGTLSVGFVVVPALGLALTLFLLGSLAAVIGSIATLASPRRAPAKVATSIVLLLVVLVASFALPRDKLGTLLADLRGGRLDFYAEGAGGAVAVLEQSTPAGSFRRLYIAGVSNSGDSLASLRYMRLQALLPLLVHGGEPRSAMVIAHRARHRDYLRCVARGPRPRAPSLRRAVAGGRGCHCALRGQLWRGRGWPRGYPCRRRSARAAAQRRCLGPDHARTATAFGRRRRQPVFARVLRTHQAQAGTGRHGRPVVAVADAEPGGLEVPGAQLRGCVPVREPVDHRGARDAAGRVDAPDAARRRPRGAPLRAPGCRCRTA